MHILIQLKGLYKTFVNKDENQLTNVINFNEISLSNWCIVYNCFRLEFWSSALLTWLLTGFF